MPLCESLANVQKGLWGFPYPQANGRRTLRFLYDGDYDDCDRKVVLEVEPHVLILKDDLTLSSGTVDITFTYSQSTENKIYLRNGWDNYNVGDVIDYGFNEVKAV